MATQQSRTGREQHIAVFGESGSGKTVLVSSFYGATQEPRFRQENLFDVVADDPGQGNRLHKNYLGMRDEARAPVQNKFAATSYSFRLRLKESSQSGSRPSEMLRVVWHDYPGEWFEQDVSGPEEHQRKVDALRALLGSDVALLLVDGQRLLDNAGDEERYLRSMLTNVRNGLLALKDEILEDGARLVTFPRIWILALSKSDLLPEYTVYDFRDLLVGKVSDDIADLREVIAGFVQGEEALSVGEDFLLLSSAKFGADKIQVTERVGLQLILPLAAMLPIERHVRWTQLKLVPRRVAESLMGGAGALATFIAGLKLKGRAGKMLQLIAPDIRDIATLARDKVQELNADAIEKKDNLRATLTRFRLDLDKAEKENVLLRSLR